jgi:hypothetical protein
MNPYLEVIFVLFGLDLCTTRKYRHVASVSGITPGPRFSLCYACQDLNTFTDPLDDVHSSNFRRVVVPESLPERRSK